MVTFYFSCGVLFIAFAYNIYNILTMEKLVISVSNEEYEAIKNNNIIEPILDPIYKDKDVVYPPNEKFLISYKCWHEHQRVMWGSSEIKPSINRDTFMNGTDPELRNIVLSMIACLMHGDSCVADAISQNILDKITPKEVTNMFTDQAARENIHQEAYSKQLDVSNNAQYYRSAEFKDKYFSGFIKFAEEYRNTEDVALMLYFIMLCENIMFAPMFHVICFLATLGVAPKLCEINLQVMRDEHIHYQHARYLLASLQKKIKTEDARNILFKFKSITKQLIDDIVGDYCHDDWLYSSVLTHQHLEYVCYRFMEENSLLFAKV